LPFIRIVAAHWVPLGAFRPRQQRLLGTHSGMRHAPLESDTAMQTVLQTFHTAYNMLCAPCRIQHAVCTVPHTTCHIHGPLCDLFSRLAEIAHAGACGALLRGALHLRRFPIRRSNAVEVLCRPCAVESTSTRTACVPLWPKPSGLQLRLPHRELRRVRPAASCSACCGPRECVSQRPTLSTHSH
jgi:hypothetical protein